MEKDLESIIAKTGDLPAMPAIAVNVMGMVGDPSTSANDLQAVIERDQALTSKVLKIANSALFGVSRDISTLSHAIMILGFSTIRSIVLATSTKSIYLSGKSSSGLSTKLLWEHSVGTSIAARTITGEFSDVNQEESFIAGLLHDVGKTVINLNFSDQYEDVLKEVYNGSERFIDVENRLLGFDHTQVGSLVLRKWNLSRSLEHAVLNHHSPENETDYPVLTAIISLSNDLCNKIGVGMRKDVEIDLATSKATEILGFDEAKIQYFEEKIAEDIEQNITLFEM